ncbi:MAG: hypothetical protein ACWGQW_09630, partial [bacterium]
GTVVSDVSIPGILNPISVEVPNAATTQEELYIRAIQKLIDNIASSLTPELITLFNVPVTGQAFSAFSVEPSQDGLIRIKKGMAKDHADYSVRLKDLRNVAGKDHRSKDYNYLKTKFTTNADFDRMAELLAEVGIDAEMSGGPSGWRKPVGGSKQYRDRPLGKISKPTVKLRMLQEDGTYKEVIVTSLGGERPITKITKDGREVTTMMPAHAAVVAKLFKNYTDRIAEIYEAVERYQVARGNAKSMIARRMFAQTQTIPVVRGDFKNAILEAKSNQRSARNQKLKGQSGRKVESEYLPIPDNSGVWDYRLTNLRIWPAQKFETDKNVIHQATEIPLGKILIQVFGGERQTQAEKEAAEIDNSTTPDEKPTGKFRVKAVEARLSVDKIKGNPVARIMVYDQVSREQDRWDWVTAYTIDLNNLKNHGLARPFTKSETKSGKTSGWYINKEAVNNSVWWTKAQDKKQRFLSPEDFAKYYPEKLKLLPGEVVAEQQWIGTRSDVSDAQLLTEQGFEDPASAEDPGTFQQRIAENAPDVSFAATRFNQPGAEHANLIDWLLDSLPGIAGGKQLAGELESLDVFAEVDEEGRDVWADLSDRILTLNKIDPNASDESLTPEDRELKDRIERAVNAVREARVAGSITPAGRVRMSAVDPNIINKPARGKMAIKDLVNMPNNGMNKSMKRFANAMLDTLSGAILEDLTFVIQPGTQIGDDITVEYAGSFSQMLRTARFIANSSGSLAAAEEMAHAAEDFLPDEYRSALREMRAKEIQALLDDPATDPQTRAFLNHLNNQDGEITTQ